MRYGFTTGSCAAAAAKAAAYMLLTGQMKTEISIETPKGVTYRAKLSDICRSEHEVSCAVEKDGGDDPDITTGALIYAKVSYYLSALQGIKGYPEGVSYFLPDFQGIKGCPEDISAVQHIIEGGKGVGRVTSPGLDQPVGSAAINHVPREMIQKEVREVCEMLDYKGRLKIEISVPEGEKLAAHTFNPKLGITGGISILGTSGIVEPMSSQAILDTIRVQLRQKRALGLEDTVISPGNYGLEFMKKTYGYDLDQSVKCSNFIGATIDLAVELGFQKILLAGHIGKLIKVAGGIMNTHSNEADCRLELLAAFSVKEQVDFARVSKILECKTTEEAVALLKESPKWKPVMNRIAERICYYMENRAKGKLKTDCILYANAFGELAKSKGAEQWFTSLEQDAEPKI